VAGHRLRWDLSRGEVHFDDLPVILAWRHSTAAGLIGGLYHAVGPRRLSLALQARGRESIEDDWQVIEQAETFEQGMEAIAQVAAVAGWGRWELVRLDRQSRQLVVRSHNSWEGLVQQELGLCWGSGLVAGKLAGYAGRLFEINCWAVQTHHIARGDAFDQFVVGPSDRTIGSEIEELLQTDQATRNDMSAALRQLREEVERRKRVEQALRESEARYRGYVDNAPDAIFILSESGRYIDVNRIACQMFGYRRKQLLAMTPRDIVVPPEWPDHARTIQDLMRTGYSEVEATFVRADGSTFPGAVTARRLSAESYIGFVRDITRLRQAQQQRERFESQFAEILRLSRDVIYKLDIRSGRYDYISAGESQVPPELLSRLRAEGGEVFLEGLHPDDLPHFQRFQRGIEAGESPAPDKIAEFRWRPTPDHEYRWYSSTPVVLYDDDGRPVSLIGNPRDVTELKRAEKQLEQLTQKLLDEHERDSRQLAMELHDSLGQDLVSLQFRLQTLLGAAKKRDCDQSAELRDAAEQCRRLVQEVRQICHGLYPPALQTLGLPGALDRLVRSSRGGGTRVQLIVGDDARGARFTEETEIAVFRVAQEALNNVRKHARAENARIELDYEEGKLSLNVRDDGKGFDIDHAPLGLGLNSLFQRAEAIGGELTIDSEPDGTCLSLVVPAEALPDPTDQPDGGR
jgi:PAS domain S-box-containing protein